MSKQIIGNIKYYTDENGNKVQMMESEVKFDAMNGKRWRRTDVINIFDKLSGVNKKMAVLNLLIKNMNGKNQIIITQKEVSEILNISIDTVSKSFIEFQALGLIKKINSLYVFNTRYISAYGSAEKNNALCTEYGFYEEEKEKIEKTSKKIEKKLKAIARMQSDIKKLQAEEKFNISSPKQLGYILYEKKQ